MSTFHKRLARKHRNSNGSKKENRSIEKPEQHSIFLDSLDESFALYYLGLTYHLKGKELLSTTGGFLDDNIRDLLNKSIVYYKQNLQFNKALNDKVAEGRTLGNIGNVNYLLQDYSTSVEYLDKRLAVAKECNDQGGQRRAHGNLGNAHLYLEDFDKALYHYREAMTIGENMNDITFIARMNFTIGRIYALKQDNETSIYFHEKHLQLARQLHDSIGQCRAYCVLSQLHQKLNQIEKANKYESLHKALAREIGEPAEDTISMIARGEKRSGPSNNFLKNLRTDSISISVSEGGGANGSSASSSHSPFSAGSNASVHSSITDVRSFAGSHNLAANDKSISTTSKKSKGNSSSLKSNFMQHLGKKSPIPMRKESLPADHDELVELVCRMQNSRFEDQRCTFKTPTTTETQSSSLTNVRGHRPSAQLEDILNTVDRLQQLRLNDQRTVFPSASGSNHDNHNNPHNQRPSASNEEFFDQLSKCQDSRFDDQRAILTPIHNQNVLHENFQTNSRPMSANVLSSESTSKTLPDDDFFSLLQRLQSRRIDQQRTCLPPVTSPPTSPLTTSSPSNSSSKQRTRVKQ